jgi:hypothetical protein
MLISVASPWVVIVDDGAVGSTDELDWWAAAITSRLHTDAFAAHLYDSDVLELRLFSNGSLLDRFNNKPGYFGAVNEAEIEIARGQPDRWASILTDGATPEALREVWDAKRTSADHILDDVAQLLGIDAQLLAVGFEGDLPGTQHTVRLNLRTERPHPSAPTGPTQFGGWTGSPRILVRTGTTTKITCSVINVGGPSTGLQFVALGNAIERGLLSVPAVKVRIGSAKLRRRARASTTETLVNGAKSLIASFPDLAIPQGVAIDFATLTTTQHGVTYSTVVAATVEAEVAIVGGITGEGQLGLAFVPREAGSGQAGLMHEVEVIPPA